MNDTKVAIIGAGPAGIACAIQLKRHGITPLIFEKNEIGGLLRNANLIENYPGFPDGISGAELCKLFDRQIINNGIKIIKSDIQKIEYYHDKLHLETESASYITKILVIASGTIPVRVKKIEFSTQAFEKVYYEIDRFNDIEGKTFAIVGAGDCAFDYALNLCKKNKVFILNRTEKVKCLDLLYERAITNSNISYLTNTSIRKADLIDNRLSIDCGDDEPHIADYLIFAIGRKPYTEFFGKTIIENYTFLVNKKRLFMIGDVKNGLYRQLSISVGNGVQAAMEISQIKM